LKGYNYNITGAIATMALETLGIIVFHFVTNISIREKIFSQRNRDKYQQTVNDFDPYILFFKRFVPTPKDAINYEPIKRPLREEFNF
jgi:uncharacterized membrane protein YdjX (TVP38/TMEM64 family)